MQTIDFVAIPVNSKTALYDVRYAPPRGKICAPGSIADEENDPRYSSLRAHGSSNFYEELSRFLKELPEQHPRQELIQVRAIGQFPRGALETLEALLRQMSVAEQTEVDWPVQRLNL